MSTPPTSPGMSPKQIQSVALAQHARVAIFEGSIRAGKTFSWILIMLWKIANAGQEGAIVIIGKNRDSIYRNVFEPIETIPVFGQFASHVYYRQGAPRALIFGRQVHVVGANDAGSESRIRGMTIQLAFCDEVTVLDPQFFKQLLGRMSVAGAQLFGTTNPDGPAHWLRRDYLRKVPRTVHWDTDTPPQERLDNWTVVRFTMDDNPALPQAYRDSVKREYSGMWYQRMILGRWVAAEGAIYESWDTATHVVAHDQLPHMAHILALGVDYGTTNATAGILLGLGTDNRLYAIAEWHPSRGTDSQLVDDLHTWQASHPVANWTFVDPAAASFSLELYQRDWPGLAKARNDVLDGIRMVASLLSSNQLKVADTCPHLIEEIPGYRWDAKATDKGLDKPIKENDHFCDALRYAVSSSYAEWQPALSHAH